MLKDGRLSSTPMTEKWDASSISKTMKIKVVWLICCHYSLRIYKTPDTHLQDPPQKKKIGMDRREDCQRSLDII